MLDDVQPPYMSSSEEIDWRTVKPEAKTMLYMSKAVDKTLSKSYRLKPNLASLPNTGYNIHAKSLLSHAPSTVFEEDSSLMSQSASVTTNTHVNFEGITFPLLNCERFVGSCWRSFYQFATEPLQHMDKCELALPAFAIQSAIFAISKKVSVQQLNEALTHFQVDEYSCLSWKEFKEMCAYIMTPLLQQKMADFGIPIKMNNIFKSGESAPDSALHKSGSAGYLPKCSQPFDQMLRKQRFMSCIDKSDLDMPTAEFSAMALDLPPSRQANGRLLKVPVPMLHDVMISHIRKAADQKRHLEMEKARAKKAKEDAAAAASAMESADQTDVEDVPDPAAEFHLIDRSSSMQTLQAHELEKSRRKHPIESLPSHCKPLLKQKVYEMTHRDESYARKWSKMKEKRDERFKRETDRKERESMMHALKKTVISSDRMDLDSAQTVVRMAIKDDREGMHYRNKQAENMSVWRRHVYQRQEGMRKEISAKELRQAVRTAVEMTNEEKQRDLEEKQFNKPESSIRRLAEYSSYNVAIPSTVVDKIKHAKRFTDYTNAKKEAEEFFERTITDRIHRYNEARTTAIARAGTRGAPVSVNTLFGDMLFSAESDSAMAGVAATVSLAYSAASLEGGSQSREQSPFFYKQDSNSLTELASREYQARKRNYEMEERGQDADSVHSDDLSWKTDPRVAHL